MDIKMIKIKDIGIDNLDLLCEGLDLYSYKQLMENPYYRKAYRAYSNMMQRCKEGSSFQKIWKTYKDCVVCDEWKQNKNSFIRWYLSNYYEVEGDTLEVDKDILIQGNKLYSPDTCLLVPHKVNVSFALSSKKHNNGLPLGLYLERKKRFAIKEYFNYIPEIFYTGKGIILRFNNQKTAEEQYRFHRRCQLRFMAENYKGTVPDKIYHALVDRALNA